MFNLLQNALGIPNMGFSSYFGMDGSLLALVNRMGITLIVTPGDYQRAKIGFDDVSTQDAEQHAGLDGFGGVMFTQVCQAYGD